MPTVWSWRIYFEGISVYHIWSCLVLRGVGINGLRSHVIGIVWVVEIENKLLNFQSQPLNKKLLKNSKSKKWKN